MMVMKPVIVNGYKNVRKINICIDRKERKLWIRDIMENLADSSYQSHL